MLSSEAQIKAAIERRGFAMEITEERGVISMKLSNYRGVLGGYEELAAMSEEQLRALVSSKVQAWRRLQGKQQRQQGKRRRGQQ